ncbi:hypothetical protein ACQPX6_27455 [Actinomycetospora sp. CA-101289]|uniref:hypothetical protein n=1 Tax=Actinomycetospora sp. CA-101289 TaxID=3239893 RepID=UPI003D993BF3
MSDPRRRTALLLAAATVVLAAGAVALLVAGVEVRETTGGLLVTPIRQVHLVGGFLLAGTVAGVAAVLTGLWAVPALRRLRHAPEPAEVPVETAPAPVAGTDPAHAASSPGSDRRE